MDLVEVVFADSHCQWLQPELHEAATLIQLEGGFVQFGLEPLAVRVGEDYFDKIHMWREL